MNEINRRDMIRTIGVYVVIIIALVRFLAYPLHTAVADKKVNLAEQYEAYKLKSHLLTRQQTERGGSTAAAAVDTAVLYPLVYEKSVGSFHIQADILDKIKQSIEKKKLTIVSYELPEPVIDKNISEVSVTVRLQGKMLDFMDLLKMLENQKRFLQVKTMEINKSTMDFNYALTITALRVEK
jgi:hypothetical protein